MINIKEVQNRLENDLPESIFKMKITNFYTLFIDVKEKFLEQEKMYNGLSFTIKITGGIGGNEKIYCSCKLQKETQFIFNGKTSDFNIDEVSKEILNLTNKILPIIKDYNKKILDAGRLEKQAQKEFLKIIK